MAEPKFFITKRAAIIWVAVILSIAFIGTFTYLNRHVYTSCAEMHRDGKGFVTKGNIDYNPALDADHDGIACE